MTVALLASGFTGLSASGAESGCRVDYTVNQWTGGYTAQLKTNLGPTVTSWRLIWIYAGDQQVTSAWNATATQTGNSVVAENTNTRARRDRLDAEQLRALRELGVEWA
ncbi:cellulose binding domain-containing protein [Streptomyces flaveolus]